MEIWGIGRWPNSVPCLYVMPEENIWFFASENPDIIYFFAELTAPEVCPDVIEVIETPDEIWVYIDHMDEVQPWTSSEWECVAYAVDSWPNCVYFFADDDTKKAAEFWQ